MKSNSFFSLVSIVFVSLLFVGCNKPAGELMGTTKSRVFSEATPVGMVMVEGGSFMMGENEQNALFASADRPIKVTVNSFWMDQTEITNDEYKQFVHWVRDSIARRLLVDAGREEFAIMGNEEMMEEDELVPLNWKRKIEWSSKKDPELQEILSELYYPNGELNTTRLQYTYEWTNYDQVISEQNRFDVRTGKYRDGAQVYVDSSWVDDATGCIHDSTVVRPLRDMRDLVSNRILCVYPDTLVWVRDFDFAYNDPYLQLYFTHAGYSDYPVVGVTWEQAVAFCNWRSMYLNAHQTVSAQNYRLPTEAEWEYAARGGRDMATYPWGSGYARNEQGCFMANFKPFRGGYAEDQAAITMKVGSYPANDYGLYDMAGNVSEWTASAYHLSTNSWVSDMNPDYQYNAKYTEPAEVKRKVIKGGSWKDISYYLQCGTRTYEYQYESRPYIGFRCVRTRIGSAQH